jgi:hypothetical protein
LTKKVFDIRKVAAGYTPPGAIVCCLDAEIFEEELKRIIKERLRNENAPLHAPSRTRTFVFAVSSVPEW